MYNKAISLLFWKCDKFILLSELNYLLKLDYQMIVIMPSVPHVKCKLRKNNIKNAIHILSKVISVNHQK